MCALTSPFLSSRCAATAAAALLGLSACTSLAPPHQRPELSLPAQYRDVVSAQAASDAVARAAELPWQQYFLDPGLRVQIRQALAHNRDLRLAVLRMQEARAAYGVQSSALLPTVALGADGTRGRTPGDLSPSGAPITASQFQAGLGVSSWELDFWGRVASLNEAALQGFLATDAARRAATIGLIAEVAQAWLGLRETDERLSLAQSSEASQRESLRIYTRRFQVGAASRLELAQVETLLTQAEALVVQLQQQRERQQHALRILLGGAAPEQSVQSGQAELPQPADRQRPPLPQAAHGVLLAPLAPGLPAELLQARPDIVAAEHQLRAADANIGAARAAFYPRIALTASGGTASSALEHLFRGANRAWSFAPSLTLSIFDAGRNQANLQLAEVRKHIAVVQYEQAIENAFRDVADALSAQHWLGQQIAVQERALQAQRERARLSRLSHDNGAASFLEVLDAERNLIAAEQQLVQARHALLTSRVTLYAALGGGALAPVHGPDASGAPADPVDLTD